MTQARFYSSTAASTTLTAGITPTAVSMAVASTTGFPASFPYTLILERDTANQEVVSVTAAAGTTLTIVRGQDGTSGIAHSITAVVEHGVSARDFTEAGQHVGGTTGVHGLAGAVVGTTDTQVLTGKTIDGGSNTLQNVPESAITSLVTDLAAKVVKATLSAKGSLLGASAAATPVDVPVGADALVLTADSSQAAGVRWAAASGGGTGIYGDGSDGAATLDGSVTVAWASKVGSVYTMTRNAFLTNLTINNGVTLIPASCGLFGTGTLTNNGTIHANGNSAVGSAGGIAPVATAGVLFGNLTSGVTGTAGPAGTATASGSFGTATAGQLGGNGGASGDGRTGGTAAGPKRPFRTATSVLSPWEISSAGAATTPWNGGASGASGGSIDGVNLGGGGGAGGGVLGIWFKTIINGATGIISAIGGAGGTPAGGNAHGGGGGGGGALFLIYNSLTNTGSIVCTPGAAGIKTGTGTNGVVGSAGTVIQISNT